MALPWSCSAWSKPKLNTKICLHTTHHPPTHQVLPKKDDICHASSYWTNLKIITSELITKEILVLVNATFVPSDCKLFTPPKLWLYFKEFQQIQINHA